MVSRYGSLSREILGRMRCLEMSYAYTPGLEVTYFKIVRKARILPITGEVLVEEGQFVESNTIVARSFLPGEPHLVNVATRLGVEPGDLEYYMLKKQGERVSKGEEIAIHKAFFGLFKSSCTSPVDGEIEFISTLTGQVCIREPPKAIEVLAYIPGKVVEVIPQKGAVIETPAAFVQGIFGVGGEKRGKLMKIAPPDEPLEAESINPECSGRILFGGSCIDFEALRKASEVGVKGIVVGGIRREDLARFLGYEIGVAVTGYEDIPFALIITEGFGNMAMADRTFELLKSFDGREASINGATQIRAGVIRPEVIIPLGHEEAKKRESREGTASDSVEGISLGMRVRIIRDPWFGSIGLVTNIPRGYHRIETESYVRVLEVELSDGKRVIVPRANVEIIKE
jgi:hypothetical protein